MAADGPRICDESRISVNKDRPNYSPKEKFDAAVNVIQGLPRNGSFQPSHEMMLRFYGYYKQATLGPCDIPQPWAWDVVGRAKWTAWSGLGEMAREEAMLLYVNELKQIIETMPQTEQVAEFIEKLGSFYELVDEAQDDTARSSAVRKPAFQGLERLMARAEIHLNGNGHGPGSDSDSELDSDKDVDTTEIRETIEHHRVIVRETCASHDSGIGLSEPVEERAAQVLFLPNPEADHNANSKKRRPDSSPPPPRMNGVPPRHLPVISSDTDSDVEFCDSTDHITAMPPLLPLETTPRLATPLDSSSAPSQSAATSHTNGPISAVSQRGGGDEQNGRGSRRGVDGTSRPPSSRAPPARPSADQTYLGSPPTVGAVGGSGGEYPGRGDAPDGRHVDPQIAVTLLRLQHDMNNILLKLNSLETHVLEQRQNRQAVQRREPGWWCRWWPFGTLPARTVVAILAWPVILQILVKLLRLVQRRRRAK